LEDSRGKVVFGLSVSLDGVVNHEMKGTGITLVISLPQRLDT
jgi:hypothetical protein